MFSHFSKIYMSIREIDQSTIYFILKPKTVQDFLLVIRRKYLKYTVPFLIYYLHQTDIQNCHIYNLYY